MFQSKSILVILLLAISQLAAAGTSHVNRGTLSERALTHRTNAARMAAGLGPLPPSQLQRECKQNLLLQQCPLTSLV